LTRLWSPSPDRLFAFGEEGVSYRRENSRWTQLETFGRAVLNDMDGQPGGPIYCAGKKGVLLRLEGTQWSRIEIGVEDHFNAVLAGAQGEIYLGGQRGAAYELRDGELIALKVMDVEYFDICEFRG
jgi:hypothetical protein